MGTYTQDNRLIKLLTPLGKDVLLLRSFVGCEGISQPFRFELDLLSENRSLPLSSVVGKKATITIELHDQKERFINGLIESISQGGTTVVQLEPQTATFASYKATLVPWLSMLGYTSDCRIFQHKKVPEIIEGIFKENGFSDFKNRLQGSFPEREYCVQWNETDFEFVTRLMEEEGIFYFFEHDDSSHTLIMANKPSEFKPSPFAPEARYASGHGTDSALELITEWNISQEIRPGKFETKDFNFEDPTLNLTQSITGRDDRKYEIRKYPGDYQKIDQGERIVGIRMEELETPTIRIQGKSTCQGFVSGFRFDLKHHYRRDLTDKPYVLTQLEHRCNQGDNFLSPRGMVDDDFKYENLFSCIPHPTPFRPPRLIRRPTIRGTQTAIVVGPPGEEIFVDKYGRVKVQFHWDREGKYDDKSSCWIRVCQPAAGKGWGAVWIPRIGQEVVVDFLDGNPDYPIITGRVYNAESMPPYTLPKEMTKSTVKTYSSKGGGGFNEIRFDDKKGDEQLFMHAEKDLDVRVKNDRREWIGNDRHLIVKRDKFEDVERDSQSLIKRDGITQIERDLHLTIKGKAAADITGSLSMAVTGNVAEQFKGSHSEEVTQGYYLKGMNVVIEGMTGLSVKVGGNFITINPAGIQIQGTMVMINSGGAPLSGMPGSLVPPVGPKDAMIADNADPGSKEPTYKNQMAAMSPTQAALAAAPTHNPNAPENKGKKHWIEIELVGEDDKPIPGVEYAITLPDGTMATGTLDEKGRARVEGIDQGSCKVTFPNLDKDAWEPA